MSTNDNQTSKIYPDLNLTAPQEPQAYCLEKLTKIEACLLDEIEVLEKLAKKIKRFNTITGIIDTSLITSTVITGGFLLHHLPVVLACPLVLL